MEIEYGSEVMDTNGKVRGFVDYVIPDTYTGDIRKFRVRMTTTNKLLLFTSEDVLEATAARIKLKIAD
jgi:sporulation protein YlmC with PRC-barrel domain